MKTLCLDSAHKYLIIGLYEDGKLVCGTANFAWKKQSETIFPELIRLCEEAHWDSDDIDEMMISDGPGSYTGVRIAMCIAKVLCTRKKIPLYVVSTLQLYAGLHKNALVMLDARSNRAYVGFLQEGVFTQEETILTLDELKTMIDEHNYALYGDCELVEKSANEPQFLDNFIALRPLARKVDNVHTLVPRYLKEQDAYKVK
ncbi:MAG: tRNA (adenosine(37)-N6)-threonylcarbamoyltransferase complex dimerization subunit type 1 TsaB [Longicatena sp.]